MTSRPDGRNKGSLHELDKIDALTAQVSELGLSVAVMATEFKHMREIFNKIIDVQEKRLIIVENDLSIIKQALIKAQFTLTVCKWISAALTAVISVATAWFKFVHLKGDSQ